MNHFNENTSLIGDEPQKRFSSSVKTISSVGALLFLLFFAIFLIDAQNGNGDSKEMKMSMMTLLSSSKKKHRHTKSHNSRYTKEAQKDQILNLPGLDYDTGFRQFSGYFSLEEGSREIFYWYVESQNDPSNDPVIFWTNGGPACSSLLGFGTEHGPYFFDEHGELTPNPFSWNKIANMLYVEIPAGTGFSYCSTKEECITDDTKTSVDNFELIEQFFKRFPERQQNDFYISSESYGGHYIPQLTLEILKRNTDGEIKFRGFLVGNPFVDPWSNLLARYEAFYSHGLVAKPLYDAFVDSCLTTPDSFDPVAYKFVSKTCDSYTKELNEELRNGINPYAIDYPLCREEGYTKDDDEMQNIDNSVAASPDLSLSSAATMRMLPVHSSSSQSLRLLTKQNKQIHPSFLPGENGYKPCLEFHFTNYVNREDVKRALHVNEHGSIVHWDACADDDKVVYSSVDHGTPVISLYKELVAMAQNKTHDLNMLIFSGDDDAICPLAGTQSWIFNLGVLPQKDRYWKAWKANFQTAGFVTHFDLGGDGVSSSEGQLVLATVHGAGHEVPSYKPLESLQLLKLYLSNQL